MIKTRDINKNKYSLITEKQINTTMIFKHKIHHLNNI